METPQPETPQLETIVETETKAIKRDRINEKDMTEDLDKLEETGFDVLKDKVKMASKVETVLKDVRRDPRVVADVMKMVSSNARIDQGARDIARNFGNAGVMGTDTPLKDRKKMQKRQQAMMAMAKMEVKAGSYSGVVINAKGKNNYSRIHYTVGELEDEKYTLQVAVVNKVPFMVVVNSNLVSGRNSFASKLIDPSGEKVAFGPVSFLRLDKKCRSLDNMTLEEFGEIIKPLLPAKK